MMYLIIEALESGMCDVKKYAYKGGMQREVGAFILFYFLLHPSFLNVFYDVTHATISAS